MRTSFILFLVLITTGILSGQKSFTLTGTVMDTAGTPLQAASLILLNTADSMLVGFTTTNEKGVFELKNVKSGKYTLQASYIGYDMYKRGLEVSDNLDLGKLELSPAIANLDEIVVEGDRSPLTIKKDTIEFNADAFKTQPNSVVEDLLKKLPGVEVEDDGNIKAQGEDVSRVLVDGKEFFGRDPKMATKNLPADAVDKVQVYDKKSDMAEFSGVDDGEREKTINLKLKNDRKKGYFGNATVAGGSEERYELKGNLNKFAAGKQFSLITSLNNINQRAFSMEDYFTSGMGGRGGMIQIESDGPAGMALGGNNRDGFNTAMMSGLNFNTPIGKKTEINGSYFYNFNKSILNSASRQENFLSDKSFINQNDQNQNTRSGDHRINLTIDHKIDSAQSIKLVSRLSAGSGERYSNVLRQTLDAGEALQNALQNLNDNSSDRLNGSANLLYRRKLSRKGRTMTASLDYGLNTSDNSGFLKSFNEFYENSGPIPVRIDTLLQDNFLTSNNYNYAANLSYIEPLSKKTFLEASYNYRKQIRESDRDVYDLSDELPGSASQYNLALSNEYTSDYTYQKASLSYRYNTDKLNFSAGIKGQQTDLLGDLITKETTISQRFTNWLPNMSLRYNLTQYRHLGMRYNSNVREPSITQLQPVQDVSDPQFIYEGNPDLQPEIWHTVSINYNAFSPSTFRNFFLFGNFMLTDNQIVESQTVDDRFVSIYKPINAGTGKRANLNANYGAPLDFLKARFSLNAGVTYSQRPNFVNGIENQVDQYGYNGGIKLENRKKEVIDVSIGGNWRFSQTQYAHNSQQNRDNLIQTYSAGFVWNLPKHFSMGTNLDYRIYSGLGADYNQNIPLWNAYIGKFFLKDQRGQIKLTATDLLNKNIGLSRTANLNYILDQRVNSLARYFLLSFTYSMRKAGGGPMIRVIETQD